MPADESLPGRRLDSCLLQVHLVEFELFDVPARVRALHEQSSRHICLQFFRLYKVENPIRLYQISFEGNLGRLAEHRPVFLTDAAIKKTCP